MEGPPLGPGGEDITWPDQVAPRGRKASSTRKIKPQTSNRHRGLRFVFGAGGCVGRCCWDGSGVLLFEVSVGCSHVCASWQNVAPCSCRLREVLVEEAVFRPFGKLYEGGLVCSAVVKDPHL